MNSLSASRPATGEKASVAESSRRPDLHYERRNLCRHESNARRPLQIRRKTKGALHRYVRHGPRVTQLTHGGGDQYALVVWWFNRYEVPGHIEPIVS
jgi:hypothetical protein